MPVLKNARHERFAQELAKGKTASEAYAAAGYEPDDGNACRLTGNDKIRTRLAELQSRAADEAVISRQKTLQELALIAFAPVGDPLVKTSDKRNALMDIAKLEGWVIDRREIGSPGEFERMSDAELVDYIKTTMAKIPDFAGQDERLANPVPQRRRGRLN